jgi:hypothetical protein
MNPITKAVISIVAGVGIGAIVMYFAMRGPSSPGVLDRSANETKTNSSAGASASASSKKVALVQSTPLTPLGPTYKALFKPESALLSAYRRSNALEEIMREVDKRPNDAEAIYIKARILERCAKRWANTDPAAEANLEKELKEGEKFINEIIPESDPQRDVRKAAMERMNQIGCKTLLDRIVPYEELNALYKTAAELGNPSAKLRQISCDIDKTRGKQEIGIMMTRDDVHSKLPTISQSQIEQLAGIIKLGHSAATARAYEILSNGYKNGHIKLAGVSTSAMGDWHRSRFTIATLLACDLGASCATDFQKQLDQECAITGHCGISDFRQFVEQFELTPARAQIADQLRRNMLDIIVTGNATAIQFDPTPASGFGAQDYSENCGNR